MKLGIVGLGKMGLALAQRLNEINKHELIVWDRDDHQNKKAHLLGLTLSTDAKSLANQCDIILSVINDDHGVKLLFEGEHGFLKAKIQDKLFIEMSTIQPETLVQIEPYVRSKGASLIGAPMMGTVNSARNGTLFLPVGGDSIDFERAMPILSLIAQNFKLMGSLGSGNVMKLISNLSMAAYIQSLAEGLSIAQSYQLDLKSVIEVMQISPSANAWLKFRGEAIFNPSPDITLDITSLRKDMMNALVCGSIQGISLGLTPSILNFLSSAVACGYGHQDIAQLPDFFLKHMKKDPA